MSGGQSGGGRPPSFASTPLPPSGTPRRQGPNSGIHNTPYQRTGANQSPIQPVGVDRNTLDICNQLLSELRRGLDEQKKVKEDVRRVGLAMNCIEESVRHLGEELKQHTEQSFSIEGSQYKVGTMLQSFTVTLTTVFRGWSFEGSQCLVLQIIKKASREGRCWSKQHSKHHS